MITKDLSSEKTTVVATYSNRHNAEVAKGLLQDRNLASFVVADDVHPPLQLTEGVRLLVLDSKVQEAHEVLDDAAMLPTSEEVRREQSEDGQSSRMTRITAWTYIAAVVLVTGAIVLGLLFSAML